MFIISFQRKKCIGCYSCIESSPLHFKMSKKDGKSFLLNSIKKKNFFILKTKNWGTFLNCKKASIVCPVKIIMLNSQFY
ncbi:MAG: 4Fe-4S domain-containing protein [Candidatus Karelsulcia muelleri]|uniref:4Fe-4S domain-containing protein n=1 Tax=Candidatus Karelsulcia muelleri TaxID=336810 RepID=UPI000D7B9E76|nr:ferredoxin [Candidatus Karelsulcia muelleri]